MANEKKKILLLSASAGAGHYRAAEALRVQAQESHPEVEVAHIDVMTLVPAGFRAVYTDFYLKLVERSPALWAYLYNMTDKMPRDALFSRLRRGVERLSTQKLHSAIRKFRPDHIVCTHFLPAELLAHEISKDRNIPPVWVQITDFDVHRMWVQTHMHGFFVASEEVAFRLSELGIPGAHIYVTGIPIMPAFSQ